MEIQVKKSKKPMILGIISLVAWIIPIVGAIVSIFGIVIASKRLKEGICKYYKIGLWLNIVGLVLSIVYFAYSYYLIMNNMF
ncbi:MAG: hypothetical protein ACLUG9_17025 [Paraclostridium sordellii]|uniref:hypothetical protein n=1 Tax=Paraclostridium sordellii TaxID=1505 RepID=UPI0005E1A8F1|nr:hypothetical protein [Paeniclostridium sordellii]MVO75961.1 hypothetical protein [Paeniclostridium sordellii]CEN29933.1 Uncharacterised protein [[Clostridium] sordellii] [Paeniclostridium sordellii]CEN30442.1 Uncharacterised protein [[Clostridium] sordellii] [Paeniclostridium sordellii]